MQIPYVNENSSEVKKLENVVMVNVTPDLASKWLSNSFGNRPYRRANLDRLENVIENNKWNPMVNSIKFSKEGKLIDGHHRLKALVKTNRTIPMKIETDFDENLAYVIDTNAESRSARDVMCIDLNRNSQNASLSAAMCQIAKSFIDSQNAVENGESFSHYGARRITAQEIQNYCHENYDEIITAINVLPKTHRVSFAGAYKIICDKDPYRGRQFFEKYKEMDWDLTGRDSNIKLLKETIERNDYPKNTAERKNKLVRQIVRCYNNWAIGIHANSRIGRIDINSPITIHDYLD